MKQKIVTRNITKFSSDEGLVVDKECSLELFNSYSHCHFFNFQVESAMIKIFFYKKTHNYKPYLHKIQLMTYS